MSDAPPNPAHIPLRVLATNRKVEEFRKELLENPPQPKPGGRPFDRASGASKTPELRAIEVKVIDALRTVFDPEIPVSIYELGLIYAIDITADHAVEIKMTLTAPGCPVAGSIVADVQRKVDAIDEVAGTTVELVWEPAWTKDRMSEAALLELGLL